MQGYTLTPTRSSPVPVEQIEAYNYKCLRAVRQPLERFHLLVGRNGAAKSVFLDALCLPDYRDK